MLREQAMAMANVTLSLRVSIDLDFGLSTPVIDDAKAGKIQIEKVKT